jgi:ribonuclease J
MAPPLTLTIHRSAHEIGGNCIELALGPERILLDMGRPLAAPKNARGLLPASLDTQTPATILISHPHQDHYGLLEEAPPTWSVRCGEPTRRLMQITMAITGRTIPHAATSWRTGETFAVGAFQITPRLTDHSAFDAHMLLIEAAGKRLLYSGDFRMHGRKRVLVERMMRAPPPDIDVLLMEGTNLDSDKPCVTEDDLEERFCDLFARTKGRVFAAWSAQNVDRTVTIYRACLKTGRTLVVDLYTAEIMAALAEFGRLPAPDWRQVTVVMTRGLRRRADDAFADGLVKSGQAISAAALQNSTEKLVIMTRGSLLRDYAAKGVVANADDAWCWSQWRGYLREPDGAFVAQWFNDAGAAADHIHTSGHASSADLRAFAAAIAPKHLAPIHGVKWDNDQPGFPPLLRLRDGERHTLTP